MRATGVAAAVFIAIASGTSFAQVFSDTYPAPGSVGIWQSAGPTCEPVDSRWIMIVEDFESGFS